MTTRAHVGCSQWTPDSSLAIMVTFDLISVCPARVKRYSLISALRRQRVSVNRTFLFLSKAWLLPLLGLMVLSDCTCTVRSWNELNPAHESKQPLMLFGRYNLSIKAYTSEPFNLFVNLVFVNKVSALANTDTIPICIVDSLSFEGACLAKSIRLVMPSWYDIERDLERKGQSAYGWPYRDKDLYRTGQEIVPGGYAMLHAWEWPKTCERNSVVTMNVYARILDRKTGAMIARDRATARYVVTKKAQLEGGS